MKKQCFEMPKMRVLMVTPSFYPIECGTEKMVRNLSKGLKKVGVHVDILTFNMDRKSNPKCALGCLEIGVTWFSSFARSVRIHFHPLIDLKYLAY